MKENNLLDVSCLTRIYPEKSKILHNNPRFLYRVNQNDLQIYSLNNTPYICIVGEDDKGIKIRWSYCRISGEIYNPVNLVSFEEVLEICSEHDVEGLLFNLDIFRKGDL